MKALMIEDDKDIVKIVQMNISDIGVELDSENDGATGLEIAKQNKHQLIIIDLMLPSIGGLEICKTIRETNKDVPILILSSKDEEIDKILGLEIGADDYMTKPFSVRELNARIKALLRRYSNVKLQVSDESEEVLDFGKLQIHALTRRVILGDKELELSCTEFDLLLFLAQHPGRPFSRCDLALHVWESTASAHDSTITSQMCRLRRKLERDIANPRYVKTVWGIGYRFARKEELLD